MPENVLKIPKFSAINTWKSAKIPKLSAINTWKRAKIPKVSAINAWKCATNNKTVCDYPLKWRKRPKLITHKSGCCNEYSVCIVKIQICSIGDSTRVNDSTVHTFRNNGAGRNTRAIQQHEGECSTRIDSFFYLLYHFYQQQNTVSSSFDIYCDHTSNKRTTVGSSFDIQYTVLWSYQQQGNYG